MKKAQDFLVDSALGEKSYNLPNAGTEEEKIKLAIEEGAVPVNLLKNATARVKSHTPAKKSVFAQFDESMRSFGSPSAKDKAAFFRLMAIMLNAGIPLIRALDTIAEQTVNGKLKRTLYEIARNIEKGGNLSGSMLNYPKIFSEEHLGMIHSGEASGQLNKILIQLATQVEKTASIKRKVKGALVYPAFIMSLLSLVVALLMMFVVPKISEVFAGSGTQLPILTRIVIGAAFFLQQKWYYVIGAIGALILGITAARNTPQGRYATDWAIVHMPLVGMIFRKSILARFSRSLANLLASGVPIIEALLIDGKSLGNEVYKQRVELAAEDISRGIPLGESLRDSPEFPAMMVQMISVGEETAQLDTMGLKIAEYYEDEVDSAVASLSSIIEPAMLLLVGGVVGTIVAAIMLPLIQLTALTSSL